MTDSLTYLYIIYAISIAIHVISVVIRVFGVLRLQIKEAGVKNGLRSLRYGLLAGGTTMVIIELASIFVLTARYFIDGELARYSIVTLVLIHALGLLSNSLVWRRMYREQFTQENKEIHVKMEKMEGGDEV